MVMAELLQVAITQHAKRCCPRSPSCYNSSDIQIKLCKSNEIIRILLGASVRREEKRREEKRREDREWSLRYDCKFWS